MQLSGCRIQTILCTIAAFVPDSFAGYYSGKDPSSVNYTQIGKVYGVVVCSAID